ncbi:hypothetical protein FOA52_014319 [Chlamydomonas sp. UWO 241]|nr:hypothetical protein FOA52_014319 [Chlamydomonas sp. UWO 241]
MDSFSQHGAGGGLSRSSSRAEAEDLQGYHSSSPSSPVPNPKANPKESALSAAVGMMTLEDRQGSNTAVQIPDVVLLHVTGADVTHTFTDRAEGVITLAVSPDSATLFGGGQGAAINEWSVGEGGEGFLLRHSVPDAHAGWVWALVVSPCGTVLYSGSGDHTIRMWAVNQVPSEPPLLRQVLEGHRDAVCSLALSPDGAYLYSGSADMTINVWDVSAGLDRRPALLQSLAGHTGYVSSLKLSSDGCTLYSAGMDADHSVRMWRVLGAKPVPPSFANRRGSVGSASDRRGSIGSVQAMSENRRGSGLSRADSGAGPSVPVLGFADRHGSGSGSSPLAAGGRRGSGSGSFAGAAAGGGSTGGVAAALGVGAPAAPTASPFDTAAPAAPECWQLAVLDGHTSGVYTVMLSPDEQLLLSGGEDGSIIVWAVDGAASTGSLVTRVGGAHAGWVKGLVLTPDGRTLLSASSDSSIKLWDVEQKDTDVLAGSGIPLQVTVSPSCTLSVHTDRVQSMRLSVDGMRLYSASADGTLRCWLLK